MLLLGSKHFHIKRSSSVTYVVDPLFHHLKVACIKKGDIYIKKV